MKKIALGIFALSVIALLGVGITTAFPFGVGKSDMKQNLTEAEQAEVQVFHDALETAIENEDFDTWKSLMESQLTEENFNNIITNHNEMQEIRNEREVYCEENNCSESENASGIMHQMKRNFKNINSTTESS